MSLADEVRALADERQGLARGFPDAIATLTAAADALDALSFARQLSEAQDAIRELLALIDGYSCSCGDMMPAPSRRYECPNCLAARVSAVSAHLDQVKRPVAPSSSTATEMRKAWRRLLDAHDLDVLPLLNGAIEIERLTGERERYREWARIHVAQVERDDAAPCECGLVAALILTEDE